MFFELFGKRGVDIESWYFSADKAVMDMPLPLILCFVFAIVVGYFAGRMIGILKRD